MMLCEVLDQRLPPPDPVVVHDIILIATIAFACLHTEPKSRPTMKCVSRISCPTATINQDIRINLTKTANEARNLHGLWKLSHEFLFSGYSTNVLKSFMLPGCHFLISFMIFKFPHDK
uniref:Uncharacterized protein n=1 Tax=Quercus lobata TaxID=97700 RepID=A0A7N2L0T8_QUELO